jgi:hypothetical protein
MNCYQNLNLPTNLLKPSAVDEFDELKYGYHTRNNKSNINTNVEDFLSEELLDAFRQQCNITPKYFLLFPSYPGQKGFLHSDVYYEDNKWNTVPCGINWDVGSTESIIQWHAPIEPVEEILPRFTPYDPVWREHGLNNKVSAAKFYGERDSKDTSKFKIIDSLIIDGNPRLFRTDIPHQVIHTNSNNISQRICISIRFGLEDISTWERALEIFKPIMG